MQIVTDAVGQPIKVGSAVAYSRSRGELDFGEVVMVAPTFVRISIADPSIAADWTRHITTRPTRCVVWRVQSGAERDAA